MKVKSTKEHQNSPQARIREFLVNYRAFIIGAWFGLVIYVIMMRNSSSSSIENITLLITSNSDPALANSAEAEESFYNEELKDDMLEEGISITPSKTAISKDEPIGARQRDKLAVFLHIHKGGGSTMCYLARLNDEKSFGGNCNAKSRTTRLKLASGSKDVVENTYGNFKSQNVTFVANEWMLVESTPMSDDLVYITMLRNPLARMESHFDMAMDQGLQRLMRNEELYRCRYADGIPSAQELKVRNQDLEVASRARTYFALSTPDNWQTRAVCGPACAQVPFGKLTDEHLDIAKRRLESTFAVVGILEHFVETITLIHDHLQWKMKPEKNFMKHKGTSHGGMSVLERVEKESAKRPELLSFARWFHATNQFDIELYNFARYLFKQQADARNIPLDLGPDIELDFVSPNQKTTKSSKLRKMLSDYSDNKNCTTQCCGKRCGPIGFYWYSTAVSLNMVPRKLGHC